MQPGLREPAVSRRRAATGAVITSTAGDPSGPTIQVQLRDGNGAPASQAGVVGQRRHQVRDGVAGGATIGGTVSDATDANGRGGVSRRRSTWPATTTSSSPAPGLGIDSGDVGRVRYRRRRRRSARGRAPGRLESGDTTATVSATSNGGVLTLSLGLDDVDCNNAVNNYYVATSEAVDLGMSPRPPVGRAITIKLDAGVGHQAVPQVRGLLQLADLRLHQQVRQARSRPASAGILPWCMNCLKPSGGPCVVAKWFDLHGNVYVKFSVPAGDPRGKI